MTSRGPLQPQPICDSIYSHLSFLTMNNVLCRYTLESQGVISTVHSFLKVLEHMPYVHD